MYVVPIVVVASSVIEALETRDDAAFRNTKEIGDNGTVWLRPSKAMIVQ
jgi:hypothetical protein